MGAQAVGQITAVILAWVAAISFLVWLVGRTKRKTLRPRPEMDASESRCVRGTEETYPTKCVETEKSGARRPGYLRWLVVAAVFEACLVWIMVLTHDSEMQVYEATIFLLVLVLTPLGLIGTWLKVNPHIEKKVDSAGILVGRIAAGIFFLWLIGILYKQTVPPIANKVLEGITSALLLGAVGWGVIRWMFRIE